MSSSSSKSSLDSGRRLPPLPEIGGSGGTVSGEPLFGSAGRAPAGVDGGTGGGVTDADGVAPTSRSPLADGATAGAGARPREPGGRPGGEPPAAAPPPPGPPRAGGAPAAPRPARPPPAQPP